MRLADVSYRLEQQSVAVRIPLGGPFALWYRSDIVPGYKPGRSARVPLTGHTPLSDLRKIRVATSLDDFSDWADYKPAPSLAHFVSGPDGVTDATVRIEYVFSDGGVAVHDRRLRMAGSDPRTEGFGGLLLEGLPLVAGSRLLLPWGGSVRLGREDEGRRVGRANGRLYVVESGEVQSIHDELSRRPLWRFEGDRRNGQLRGPEGESLGVSRRSDGADLTVDGRTTNVSMSGWATRVASTPEAVVIGLENDGLITSLADSAESLRFQYDDHGRLTDLRTQNRRLALQRVTLPDGYRVSAADGEWIDESIEIRFTPDGIRTEHRCCGQGSTVSVRKGNVTKTTRPDGTALTRVLESGTTASELRLPSGAIRRWKRSTENTPEGRRTTFEAAGQTWTTRFEHETGRIERLSPTGRVSLTEVDEVGRVELRQDLSGARQRNAWASKDGVTITGSLGKRTVERSGGNTVTMTTAAGTMQRSREADASLVVTTPTGVQVRSAWANPEAHAAVNGSPYVRRSFDGDGTITLTHGDNILAAIRQRGPVTEVTSESTLRTETDLAGRPLAVSGDEIDRRFQWSAGRLERAEWVGGSQRLEWDGRELVALEDRLGSTERIEYVRDANGDLAATSILGEVFQHRFEDGVATQLGPLSWELDDRWARPIRGTCGQMAEEWGYDDEGRVATRLISVNGRLSFAHEVERDATARITSQSARGPREWSAAYRYGGERLAAVEGSKPERFEYDAAGRVTRISNRSVAVNGAGAPTAIEGDPVVMTNGRRIAEVTVDGVATRLAYNAAGELTQIETGDSTTVIDRDALGRPVRLATGAATRRVVWDGAGPVALLDGTDVLIERYLRRAGMRTPDVVLRGGTTLRLVTDQLGSPLALIDVDSGETEQFTWSAYGEQLSGPAGFLFGYAGSIVLSEEPHVLDIGVRSFLPAIGRWAQWDPKLHFGGGTDLYGYAANDPVNNHDPTGMAVYRCGGDIHVSAEGMPDPLPKYVSFGVDHVWIVTDKHPHGVGMDRIPGQGIDTQWTSHQDGDFVRWYPNTECELVPNVDEECVDRLIEPGRRIGIYGSWIKVTDHTRPFGWEPQLPRTCYSAVSDVFEACAVEEDPEEMCLGPGFTYPTEDLSMPAWLAPRPEADYSDPDAPPIEYEEHHTPDPGYTPLPDHSDPDHPPPDHGVEPAD